MDIAQRDDWLERVRKVKAGQNTDQRAPSAFHPLRTLELDCLMSR
jgi:hypothetical protein